MCQCIQGWSFCSPVFIRLRLPCIGLLLLGSAGFHSTASPASSLGNVGLVSVVTPARFDRCFYPSLLHWLSLWSFEIFFLLWLMKKLIFFQLGCFIFKLIIINKNDSRSFMKFEVLLDWLKTVSYLLEAMSVSLDSSVELLWGRVLIFKNTFHESFPYMCFSLDL